MSRSIAETQVAFPHKFALPRPKPFPHCSPIPPGTPVPDRKNTLDWNEGTDVHNSPPSPTSQEMLDHGSLYSALLGFVDHTFQEDIGSETADSPSSWSQASMGQYGVDSAQGIEVRAASQFVDGEGLELNPLAGNPDILLSGHQWKDLEDVSPIKHANKSYIFTSKQGGLTPQCISVHRQDIRNTNHLSYATRPPHGRACEPASLRACLPQESRNLNEKGHGALSIIERHPFTGLTHATVCLIFESAVGSDKQVQTSCHRWKQ